MRQRSCGTRRIAIITQSVQPAFALDQCLATVGRPATTQRITCTVAESTNPRTIQGQLRRLHEARTVGHFAEVPTLADQVHPATRGRIHATPQGFHHRTRLVAHQVETEGIDLVVGGPQFDRVGHQLAHHQVFGGRVRATGRTFHYPAAVESLVIPRHDAIQHRRLRLSRRGGVVVDHIHAHAQASTMQCHHHAAEFTDARCAIFRIAGIAAFGRIEVIRVIAPVEAVLRRHSHHCRLLLQAVRWRIRHLWRHAASFGHGSEIEYRQQMHIGQACR